ncbi:MAG: 4Fe-4S binding protein [Candidatus Thorarchaeota archaeon]
MVTAVNTGKELNSAEIALLSTIEVRMQGTKGCILCGLCTDLCPWDAPIIIDRELIVRQDRCRGCGVCVSACPKMAIDMRVYGTDDLLELIEHVLTEDEQAIYPHTVFDSLTEVEQALLHIERILSHRPLDSDVEGMIGTLKRIIERIFRTQERIKREVLENTSYESS